MVQKIIGFALFCGSMFMIWQGYENSRLTPETLRLSRIAACEGFGGCMRGTPSKSKSDVVRRQYQWLTNRGPYVATCKRALIFSGSWSCTAEPGSLGIGGEY
jgi:hypothetical protein